MRKEDGSDDSIRERTRQGTQVGHSLPVIFTISSAKGTNYLRSISLSSFNDDSNSLERITESLNAENVFSLPAGKSRSQPDSASKQLGMS